MNDSDSQRLDWILENCEIRWTEGQVKLRDRKRIDSAIFIKEYFRENAITDLAALGNSVKPKNGPRRI